MPGNMAVSGAVYGNAQECGVAVAARRAASAEGAGGAGLAGEPPEKQPSISTGRLVSKSVSTS